MRDGVPDPGHRRRRPATTRLEPHRRSWSGASRSRCASPRRARGRRSSTSTATPPRWCRRRRRPPPTTCGRSAPQAAVARRRCRSRRTRGAPRRTYGVKEQHRNSWGWKVSAYLWTKSIAAGAFLVPALLVVARSRPGRPLRPARRSSPLCLPGRSPASCWSPDLRQPQRFLWTLTQPQWRSLAHPRAPTSSRPTARCSALHLLAALARPPSAARC